MTKQEMIDQEPDPVMKEVMAEALEDGKDYLTLAQFEAEMEQLIAELAEDAPKPYAYTSSHSLPCYA